MLDPVILQRDYVCSICWSDLTTYTENHETWIGCSKYKAEHKGSTFSRRSGVDAARRRSKEELAEVKDGLKNFDWFGWQDEKADHGTSEDIIKSLGY